MRNLSVFCLRVMMAVAIMTTTLYHTAPTPAGAEEQAYQHLRTIGGLPDGHFYSPNHFAVDTQGNVYLADSGNNRIQVFDSKGVFLRKWGSAGSADGQFNGPDVVAVDVLGNLYVNDGNNYRIQVFDSQGTFLRKWGSFGSADGLFNGSATVAVDAQGDVYVADAGNSRIQVFDSQGGFLRKWGSYGTADGQFKVPGGVAVDAQGNVYVADSANRRVQVFAPNFPLLKSPQSGASLTALTTTLSWSNPPDATQYHLQVTPANNDGPGINIVIGDPGLVSAASFALQAPVFGTGPYLMLPAMSYSWRIRVTTAGLPIDENSTLWGAWSESRHFRTPAPSSSTISAASPVNGTTVTSAAPLALQWNNTATDIFYYEVQVSGDPTFNMDPATGTSFVWQNLVHGGVTAPPNSFLTPELPPSTTIYWRVRPRVQGDGTPVDWSATWSFITP